MWFALTKRQCRFCLLTSAVARRYLDTMISDGEVQSGGSKAFWGFEISSDLRTFGGRKISPGSVKATARVFSLYIPNNCISFIYKLKFIPTV